MDPAVAEVVLVPEHVDGAENVVDGEFLFRERPIKRLEVRRLPAASLWAGRVRVGVREGVQMRFAPSDQALQGQMQHPQQKITADVEDTPELGIAADEGHAEAVSGHPTSVRAGPDMASASPCRDA